MIGGGRSARAAGAGGRLRAVPSGAGRGARSVGPGEGRPAAGRPGADIQTAGPADAIRPRAMPPHITRGNASRAQVRVAIEHVFAAQRCRFRPVIRSVGMARARPSSGSPTWSPTCTASPGPRHGRFRPERRERSSTARHHAPAAPSTRNRTCRAQRRPERPHLSPHIRFLRGVHLPADDTPSRLSGPGITSRRHTANRAAMPTIVTIQCRR